MRKTGRAAVVDPGGDLELIEQEVARQHVQVEKVLLTHGHVDHCAGAKRLAAHYGVPIEGPHEDERFWIEKLPMQSERFGFPAAEAFEPDRWLADGDTLAFGEKRSRSITALGTRRATSYSSAARIGSRSSATCCSPVRSAAPTSRAATTRT